MQHATSHTTAVQSPSHLGSALSPLLFVIVMEVYLENSQLPYHGSYCMQMTWLW